MRPRHGIHGFDGAEWSASSLPEWPTMSALAKFMIMASNSPFSMALNHGVGNARGGHFGLQVVGGHFGRGHQDALFAGERLLHAAIEKVGDVRVLFGFGDAQIAKVRRRRKPAPECVRVFPAPKR